MNHPSFFALDAFAVDPREGDVQQHLMSCPQCRAHVEAVRVPALFPEALAALPRPARTWARRPVIAFGGLVAAAAALAIGLVSSFAPSEHAGLTAKGSPEVVVWLNRQGTVMKWSGQPLRAKDAVRLEVAPAGLDTITVFDEVSRTTLYSAAIPPTGTSLTPAWAFDGESEAERLRVVVSRGPVPPDTLTAAQCTAQRGLLCVRFELRREAP